MEDGYERYASLITTPDRTPIVAPVGTAFGLVRDDDGDLWYRLYDPGRDAPVRPRDVPRGLRDPGERHQARRPWGFRWRSGLLRGTPSTFSVRRRRPSTFLGLMPVIYFNAN